MLGHGLVMQYFVFRLVLQSTLRKTKLEDRADGFTFNAM